MPAVGHVSAGSPKVVTATGVIQARDCVMIGFYVNSTTTGTIQFFDSPTTNANPISGVITPAIGWNAFPVALTTGLYVVVANTLNATVLTI